MHPDKLELSTETLRDLTTDELGRVGGGAVTLTGMETYHCPTQGGQFTTCLSQITANCFK